jgi:hypothetical protein
MNSFISVNMNRFMFIAVLLGAGSTSALAQETKPLQAVVMDVTGTAEWRPAETAEWKAAAKDDMLDPGAQVRTGLRSSLTLRVGKNATLIVDRSTRLDIPEIVQDGETLRTRAAVRRGRAEFKVDEVGLRNDFEVITPSGTLSVRGTGFALLWGALEGTDVEMLSIERIHAIEVRYFLTDLALRMEGRGTSRERVPDPVVVALFNTIGPPPNLATLAGTLADAAGETGSPRDVYFETLRDLRRTDLGFQGLRESLDIARKRDEQPPPEEPPPEEPPPEEPPPEEPPPEEPPPEEPPPEEPPPNPDPDPNPPPPDPGTRPPRPR